MPNTYSQLHIHLVFAVKGRQSLLHSSMREPLYRYITGIVQQRRHRMIAINGMSDHLHLLISLRPDTALSDLVRDIKSFSSKQINREGWVAGRFEWQEGFGAFACSRSLLPGAIRYIMEQEKHHRKRTFLEEYEALLKAFEIEYEERYLFTAIDSSDIRTRPPSRG